MNEYVEDEFDRLAKERQSLGAHRQPKRGNPWLIALVAVLVIGPLLGWGIGLWMAGESRPHTQSSASQTAVEEQAQEEKPQESGEPAAAEPAAEAPAVEPVKPQLDMSISVRVLNGRGEQGLANQIAELLQGEGYSDVTGGDYTGGGVPVDTTVYYSSEEFKDEAEDIAQKIGGGEVKDGADISMSSQIVVVMR